jgi:membrane protease YdiL (CAAX protease family)
MQESDGTPSVARQRLRRFRVPVLVIALAAVLLGTRGLNVLAGKVPVLGLVVGFATAVGALCGYVWLSKTVELRPSVPELAPATRWPGVGRGAAIGSAAFVAVMALIWVFGGVQAMSWGSVGGFLVSLGAFASVAVNEELLFRGVVFRVLEERVGTWLALVVSSLLFGLIHLVNGGATLEGTLAIALQGGVMMASAYIATRSLWVPIALHFAWDFMESGVFSVADSGTASDGLLHTTLSGPTVLTGGAFGPEAGLVALVVCAVPTVLFLRSAARRGLLHRAPWRAVRPAPAGPVR